MSGHKHGSAVKSKSSPKSDVIQYEHPDIDQYTVFRKQLEKKHYKKNHFVITKIPKNGHPSASRITGQYALAVNGQLGGKIHFKKGRRYFITYLGKISDNDDNTVTQGGRNTEDDDSDILLFTEDPAGGKEAKELHEDIDILPRLNTLSIRIEKWYPDIFYYQDKNDSFLGGPILVANKQDSSWSLDGKGEIRPVEVRDAMNKREARDYNRKPKIRYVRKNRDSQTITVEDKKVNYDIDKKDRASKPPKEKRDTNKRDENKNRKHGDKNTKESRNGKAPSVRKERSESPRSTKSRSTRSRSTSPGSQESPRSGGSRSDSDDNIVPRFDSTEKKKSNRKGDVDELWRQERIKADRGRVVKERDLYPDLDDNKKKPKQNRTTLTDLDKVYDKRN